MGFRKKYFVREGERERTPGNRVLFSCWFGFFQMTCNRRRTWGKMERRRWVDLCSWPGVQEPTLSFRHEVLCAFRQRWSSRNQQGNRKEISPLALLSPSKGILWTDVLGSLNCMTSLYLLSSSFRLLYVVYMYASTSLCSINWYI